jgi:hypothetical protein
VHGADTQIIDRRKRRDLHEADTEIVRKVRR